MAPRYRKIDPRMWKDEGFRVFSIQEKLIAVYCITAQSNRIGIFNFSPALAAEDLNMPLGSSTEGCPQPSPIRSGEGFMEGFGRVCKTLSWRWDSDARVLYLPSWWKYNSPDGANVLKSCLDDVEDLPQTPLLAEFYENVQYLKESLHQSLRGPSPQPSPHQEQEQEQESLAADKPPHTNGKPRERNEVWDAVVKITGADETIPVAKGAIGKTCKELKAAKPPYTAADVLALPEAITRSGMKFEITVSSIPKHIHLVRRKRSQAGEPAVPDDASILREREEAVCRKATAQSAGSIRDIAAQAREGKTT